MIKTEYYTTRRDGVKLVLTYSDNNNKIIQNETGSVYEEAIDISDDGLTPKLYSYTESEEEREPEPPEDATNEKATD